VSAFARDSDAETTAEDGLRLPSGCLVEASDGCEWYVASLRLCPVPPTLPPLCRLLPALLPPYPFRLAAPAVFTVGESSLLPGIHAVVR
jgi:hypothetical protein